MKKEDINLREQGQIYEKIWREERGLGNYLIIISKKK